MGTELETGEQYRNKREAGLAFQRNKKGDKSMKMTFLSLSKKMKKFISSFIYKDN